MYYLYDMYLFTDLEEFKKKKTTCSFAKDEYAHTHKHRGRESARARMRMLFVIDRRGAFGQTTYIDVNVWAILSRSTIKGETADTRLLYLSCSS